VEVTVATGWWPLSTFVTHLHDGTTRMSGGFAGETRRERVLSYFARIWRVEGIRDVVLAAARDRAITSLDRLHTFGREMMLPFLDHDADDVLSGPQT
jgi:hypothetical protein